MPPADRCTCAADFVAEMERLHVLELIAARDPEPDAVRQFADWADSLDAFRAYWGDLVPRICPDVP